MKRGGIEHPKTKRFSRALGIPLAQAVGHLESLYHWTARFAPCGDVGRFDDADIAEGCLWEGDPVAFIEALVSVRVLERSERHRIVVHDWHDHADEAVRKLVGRNRWEWASKDNDHNGQCLDTSRQNPDTSRPPVSSIQCPVSGLQSPDSGLPSPPADAGSGGRAGSEWEHCADHPAITDGDSCSLDAPSRSPNASGVSRPPPSAPKPLAPPPEFSAVMPSAWSLGGAASHIATFYPPSRASGAKRATIAAIEALARERFDGQWERSAVWLLRQVQTYAASPWVQSHIRQGAEQYLPFLKTWMESGGFDDPPATWQAERREDSNGTAKKGPDLAALRKHLEETA